MQQQRFFTHTISEEKQEQYNLICEHLQHLNKLREKIEKIIRLEKVKNSGLKKLINYAPLGFASAYLLQALNYFLKGDIRGFEGNGLFGIILLVGSRCLCRWLRSQGAFNFNVDQLVWPNELTSHLADLGFKLIDDKINILEILKEIDERVAVLEYEKFLYEGYSPSGNYYSFKNG